MKNYEKFSNDQLCQMIELSVKNTKKIESELLEIKKILNNYNKIEEADFYKIKNSILTIENNLKSTFSSKATINLIDNCMNEYIYNKIEKILKKFNLIEAGEILIDKNKLSFVLDLRPNTSLIFFEINLSNFNLKYTNSADILKAIDNHLDYLKNSMYKWRSTNSELKELRRVLYNQKKLNKFLEDTEINQIISDLNINKYSIINRYYKNIIESRINSMIKNNEMFIKHFEDHLLFSRKTRTAVARIYDEELVNNLMKTIEQKRD